MRRLCKKLSRFAGRILRGESYLQYAAATKGEFCSRSRFKTSRKSGTNRAELTRSPSFHVRALVASPASQGMWPFNEPAISTSPDGRLGRFVLGFGQDLDGEVYVLTAGGPGGGEVFRIVAR